MLVGYRTGDMWAPQLAMTEALSVEARTSSTASTSKRDADDRRPAGLRVVRLLEAATELDARPGAAVSSPEAARRMIPFVDLQGAVPHHQARDRRGDRRVLETRSSSSGQEVAAFEEEFAAYCGAAARHRRQHRHQRAASGLLAAGVGPGDEVITVPFTFVATVAAIVLHRRHAGLRRHRPEHVHDGSGQLEAAITPRTKAILPVHLYGQPADMDPILAIAAGTAWR